MNVLHLHSASISLLFQGQRDDHVHLAWLEIEL